MAASCNRFCVLFVFSLLQLCTSIPILKLSYQNPFQTTAPGQGPRPPAQQGPIMTKLAQLRAKLMAIFQKKLNELQIIANFRPNFNNPNAPQFKPQFLAGLQQIPGFSQLQGMMPGLLPPPMNPPMYPPAQSPVPGQPFVGQPGFTQPIATGGQPLVQTPVGNPVGQPQFGNPVGQPQDGNPVGQPQVGTPVGQPPVQAPGAPQFQAQPPMQTPVAPQQQQPPNQTPVVPQQPPVQNPVAPQPQQVNP